jgi:hypothetical protein
MNIIAGSEALSEFQGYFGDCGQTAELVALHLIKHLPLDAAHLNQIVRRDIAHGYAGASGAEPLSSIASDLRIASIRFELVPYREPFGVSWPTLLHQNAGRNPVVVQVSRAGVLHGDEPGVRYHFLTIVGSDGRGGFVAADGDNQAARQGRLVTYSEAQLVQARPCGLIVCFGAPQPVRHPTAVLPYVFAPDGTARDTETGETLSPPFARYVREHHITLHCELGDTEQIPGERFAAFERGLVLYARQHGPVTADEGGYVVRSLNDMLISAQSAAVISQSIIADLEADVQTLSAAQGVTPPTPPDGGNGTGPSGPQTTTPASNPTSNAPTPVSGTASGLQ